MKTKISRILLLTIVLMLCAGYLQATTIALTPTIAVPVAKNGAAHFYVYESTDSIAADNSTIFKIDTPHEFGTVETLRFNSSSPNVDYFLSNSDNQTATSVQTILSVENVIYGPGLPDRDQRIDYYNRDASQGKYLYFTISNQSATNTGNWYLTVIYGRRE